MASTGSAPNDTKSLIVSSMARPVASCRLIAAVATICSWSALNLPVAATWANTSEALPTVALVVAATCWAVSCSCRVVTPEKLPVSAIAVLKPSISSLAALNAYPNPATATMPSVSGLIIPSAYRPMALNAGPMPP